MDTLYEINRSKEHFKWKMDLRNDGTQILFFLIHQKLILKRQWKQKALKLKFFILDQQIFFQFPIWALFPSILFIPPYIFYHVWASSGSSSSGGSHWWTLRERLRKIDRKECVWEVKTQQPAGRAENYSGIKWEMVCECVCVCVCGCGCEREGERGIEWVCVSFAESILLSL